jgi:hypothetical protein
MCFKHWTKVPSKIQRAVWATYRPGQCDDKEPSEAWHAAADAAIGYVAALDRQFMRVAEVTSLRAMGYETTTDDHGHLVVKVVAVGGV